MQQKVYRVPDHERRNRKKYLVYGLVAVVLVIAALATFRLMPDDPAPTSASKQTAPPAAAKAESKTVEGRYLFSGTIVLARAVERDANNAGSYAHTFSQFHTFQPEQYDGWLADLECPVTTNTVTYQQQIENLVFNCRPEWLPELTKYIQFINLANNHTSDMGRDGFEETQKHLTEAGAQIVGNYDPSIKEDICEVMALPVRIVEEGGEQVNGTLPVAFCAWHYFSRQPQPGEMEVMERYAKVMPVFAFMHAGAEYYATAGQDQVSIAHRLIDLGSEFVVGNSPHWVQNSEVYKDKLIVYSTGNFIFDQLDYETQRGVSLDASLKLPYDKNVAEWLALAEKCQAKNDNCLELAEAQGLDKVDLQLDYKAFASSGGNRKLTQKADPALQAAVEERLNWAESMQALSND